MNYLYLTIILIACPFLVFSQNQRLENVLKMAGENRKELDQVLKHYTKDSLKLKAAIFLIENMENNETVKVDYTDSQGKNIPITSIQLYSFDIEQYVEKNNIQVEINRIPDVETITANYLIRNIDQAFDVWQKRSKSYCDFDNFCEYILPYRLKDEQLSDWRTYFQDYYKTIDTTLIRTEPTQAFSLMYKDVKTWFKSSRKAQIYNNTQSLQEMLHFRSGTCHDFLNVYLYATRALGIPSAYDYLFYGNRDIGHTEVAIMKNNGQMAILATDVKEISWNFPKVFRLKYSQQANGLAILTNYTNIPEIFQEPRMIDVTSEYTSVANVSLNLSKEKIDKQKYAYICVFNGGEWRPMWWSEIKENKVCFTNMGKDIVYLCATYSENRLHPVSQPFWLKDDGSLQFLPTDTTSFQTLTVDRIKYHTRDWKNVVPKRIYQTMMWENGNWKRISRKKAAPNQPLILDRFPKNGLFRIIDTYRNNNKERIFFFNDGKIEWK